jgi:hypothetical protein
METGAMPGMDFLDDAHRRLHLERSTETRLYVVKKIADPYVDLGIGKLM